MPFQYEINGQKVEFQKEPTNKDIDEAATQLKSSDSGIASDEQLQKMARGEDKPKSSGKNSIQEFVPGIARGIVQGGQGMLETGVNANELLAKLIGQTPMTPFGEAPQARKFVEESKQGLDQLIPPSETVGGKIGEGLGQVPSMVATFSNPVTEAIGAVPSAAILGGVNQQQNGPLAMAGGAALNAGQMAILGAAQKMNPIGAALTGAATMGIPALLSGNDTEGGGAKDAIAQATLGAAFSLYHPDTMSNLKGMFETANHISKSPGEKVGLILQALETDKVADIKAKIKAREDSLNSQTVAATQGYQQELDRRIASEKAKTQEDQAVLKSQMKDADFEKQAHEAHIDSEIRKTSDFIQSGVESLTTEIPKMAVEQTKDVQKRLYSFQDQANKQYGPILAESANRVDSNSPVTRDFNASMYTDLIQQAGQSFTPATDPVLKKIVKEAEALSLHDPIGNFYEKYPNLNTNQGKKMLESGQIGDPRLQAEYLQAKADATRPIDFKDFYSKARAIYDAHPDSHLASQLRAMVGGYIAKVDPVFAKLQEEYSHFASFRDDAESIMQSYKGKGVAFTKGGEDLFSRIAKGKESGSDQNLVHYLETGMKGEHLKIEGLGDITSQFKTISEKLANYSDHLKQVQDRDYGVYGQQLLEIARNHSDQISKLSEAHQMTSDMFQQKVQDMVKDITQKRDSVLKDLGNKKDILQKRKQSFGKVEASINRVERISNALTSVMRATGLYHASWATKAGLQIRKALKTTSRLSFSRTKR